jgi:hypothetical protein
MIVGPDCGGFAGIVVHGLERAEEDAFPLATTYVIQPLAECVREGDTPVDVVDADHLGVAALVQPERTGDVLSPVVDAVDTELVTNFRHVNLTCVVGNAMLLR